MERRIAESSHDVLGTNLSLAQLLIEAHDDLRRFAVRHSLIDSTLAQTSEDNVSKLKFKVGMASD